MEYPNYMDAVQKLDFIPDEATADAAVKAVLGILASRVPEADARALTESLPEPLSFERLRSHQARETEITSDQYLAEIGRQFKLDSKQAQNLVCTIFRKAKDGVDEEVMHRIENDLPSDWGQLFREC